MKCKCGERLKVTSTNFPKRYRKCKCGNKATTIEIKEEEYKYLLTK